MQTKRSTKDVIDSAIKDNNYERWAILILVILFCVVALLILIVNLYRGEPLQSLISIIPSSVVIPLLSILSNIRQQNMIIRSYEAAIDNSKAPEQVIKTLSELMLNLFSKKNLKV